MRPPRLRNPLHLGRSGQLRQPVMDHERPSDPETADGEHVWPPQPKDQEHVVAPGANAADGAQRGYRVGHAAGPVTVNAAPSSAPSARSTEVAMHVNVGVSRNVYELDSVVRKRCTRSRKSAGLSVSNATTNSWSSRPNEYEVLR